MNEQFPPVPPVPPVPSAAPDPSQGYPQTQGSQPPAYQPPAYQQGFQDPSAAPWQDPAAAAPAGVVVTKSPRKKWVLPVVIGAAVLLVAGLGVGIAFAVNGGGNGGSDAAATAESDDAAAKRKKEAEERAKERESNASSSDSGSDAADSDAAAAQKQREAEKKREEEEKAAAAAADRNSWEGVNGTWCPVPNQGWNSEHECLTISNLTSHSGQAVYKQMSPADPNSNEWFGRCFDGAGVPSDPNGVGGVRVVYCPAGTKALFPSSQFGANGYTDEYAAALEATLNQDRLFMGQNGMAIYVRQ